MQQNEEMNVASQHDMELGDKEGKGSRQLASSEKDSD